MRSITFLLGLVSLLAGSLTAVSVHADSVERQELEVFGWVERIELLDGTLSLKAKLDTGAANSSLDATDIERFRKNDKRWVRFKVTDPDSGDFLTLEKPLVRNVRIVRHGGDYQRRPVVLMPICLGDRRREVEVNLIDRSSFIYPMLLGRSALKEFALVDSGQTFAFPPKCGDRNDG